MKKCYNIGEIFYIYLISILIINFPLISCNYITMKFKGTGNEDIFINKQNGIDCPNRIYIDEILIPNNTCKYIFPNKIVSIKMEWDKIFIHCYKMFANISNIIEIDLSQFNTSLIKSMSYMFENCKSLTFVNLSNIDVYSLINIENIFRNCKSLKSIDLTNVNISKIPNHEKYFFKYIKLKNNNIYTEFNSDKTELKTFNEQNKEINNNNKIRTLSDNECNLTRIFSGDDCLNNTQLVEEYIIERISKENYWENLQDKNRMNGTLNTEQFSLSKLSKDDSINLGECVPKIKNYYNFSNDKELYIYKHEIFKENQINPEIDFIIFAQNERLNISICSNEIVEYIYNVSDKIEINKYEPKNYCYLDKNEKMNYNRGSCFINNQENNKNQTFYLCQENCKFTFIETGQLHCQCLIASSSQNSLINPNDECLIKLDKENITDNNEILNFIIDNILQSFSQEKGFDQFIEGFENIIYQITTTENQLDLLKDKSKNKNKVSLIDLGDCEDKLREEYHINKSDSLIIIKYENVSNNLKASEKNIQYDVFEPYNKTKLNLSICEDISVNIFVKMELSQNIQKVYDQMKEQGYDMFNLSDKFYQDICTPYKSEDNTDILLSDRKNYIYNNDDTRCQPNCYFSEYSIESEYMSCICSVNGRNSITKIEEFKAKKLYEMFIDVLKYSNCDVLKCYQLVFDKNSFTKNIGSIIILLYFVIYLVCYIFFVNKSETPLKTKLFNMIDNNTNIKDKENIIIINQKKSENKVSYPPKKKSSKKLNLKPISIFNGKEYSKKQKIKLKQYFGQKNLCTPNESSINSKEKIIFPLSLENDKKSSNNEKTENKDKELTDYELNELEYEEAVKLDKRNFFKIYFAALKREHIIIFTFFSCNDYNLMYIKIAKFFVLIATDMAMNVFFFTDESMHKIFLSYGKYDFVQQIPQIVYSTLISQILEILLCYLSMTDKYMYQIKNSKLSSIQIMNIFRCINFKLINFFIFTFLLFCFYWYIVASFCAVYENTQIIFIKDLLSSFLLGIIYPIFIYLIPSGFRLCSIKSTRMKYKWLYKLSDIIPFF